MIKKNFECNYIQHNWGYCPDEIYSNYSELQNFNDAGSSLCLLENAMFFAGAMAGAVVFTGSCTAAARPAQPRFHRAAAFPKSTREDSGTGFCHSLYRSVHAELGRLSDTADSSPPAKLFT